MVPQSPSRRRLLGLTVFPVLFVAAVLTAVIGVGAIPAPLIPPAGELDLPTVVALDVWVPETRTCRVRCPSAADGA